ncbi:MAG: transcription-repair coupling factor [Rikenellaceae bacterium]
MNRKPDAPNVASLLRASKGLKLLAEALKSSKSSTIHLEGVVSAALSSYISLMVEQLAGTHIIIADDRDSAGYMLWDLYNLLGEENPAVLFFPSSYKRSSLIGAQDSSSLVQRTEALAALSGVEDGYRIVVSYPEAIAQSVIDPDALTRERIELSTGESVSPAAIVEMIEELGFERVDFVYEPGQYSQRGSIIDIFSYSCANPYRIDMFDNDIDSIRTFNISSQLSLEKLDKVSIIPNINGDKERVVEKISFTEFVGEGACYWFLDAGESLRRVDDVRRRLLTSMDEPATIDNLVSSAKGLLEGMKNSSVLSLRDNIQERRADKVIEFSTSPQPNFNKSFEVLAADMISSTERGYRSYILSRNKAQIERLDNIFHQIGYKDIEINSIDTTLNQGFIDHEQRVCIYVEHQIFERYQRYKIRGEIKRDEQMTIAELNALKMGDYVVHYDHGVGRFAGLVKVKDSEGKVRESIKLVYKDNDVLFVNVHSFHRISRYRSGDGEPPKVYKLGTGAWQKIKNRTKSSVKDISRELISLYAKRKQSEGFAFSPDGYLQTELEASFPYEDTPDQSAAAQAVKQDMESSQPMDRLVCGDVGFGKTEVAIRAAFKAATDGKQAAVLVPTTILAMQHYRTFMRRLRDMPVKIEYINRTKSTKEVNRIIDELATGEIDILIGTHKILGKSIKFKDLGLLIIDEEQKFGVAAKEKLTQLSVSVDTLTLTATPIPRTLQFSIMGSRDLSIISTPPPNRQPIITESHLFNEDIIAEAIESELSRGGQIYFVHNRVEDMDYIHRLIGRIVPNCRVGVGHGQMPAKDLEALIMSFIYGEIDLLLATTIIENGIDVPNANTIIINNAHRFGVSALHQLRGRVGRSDRKAYCYLLSPPEEMLSSDASRRLRAIEEFSDLGSGFNIAMQDLDIRGAGNLLGAEQSGFIADIGIETYQKILNEAIVELRNEGFDVTGLSNEEQQVVTSQSYVDDVVVDIDVDASLPENYVQQSAERLRLYRELDSMSKEESLESFAARLRDRFGELPKQSIELLNVVRLRREARRLGIERVKIKNGLMITHFVSEQNSTYYQSDIFRGILEHITKNSDRFVLRQNNNKLGMTVRRVKDIGEGYEILKGLA